MIFNKIRESTGRTTIRDVVDRFEDSKSGLTAVQMKVNNGYKKYTYGELREAIRFLSNAMLRMGIKKGENIGLISENRIEWVLTYLAVTYMGAVITPFDTLLKQNELSEIIKASGAKYIFSSGIHLEKVLFAFKNSLKPAKIILFDEDPLLSDEVEKFYGKKGEFSEIHAFREELRIMEEKEFASLKPFHKSRFIYFESLSRLGEKLVASGLLYYVKAAVEPGDIASLLFTSGTTGSPKGVMLSHGNLITNADGLNMETALGPGDNWIIVLPYHHAYPTILGIILPIMTYATITTIPTLRPNVLIQTMQETGATCIPAVPMLIEKIYKNIFTMAHEKGLPVYILFRTLFWISRIFYAFLGIKIGPVLFRSIRRQLGVTRLKFFISGAGPIPREIIDGMETLGLIVMQGYGLTESSPVISATVPENNRPGTVGLPLCNIEVKIDKPDQNGDGELLTRGPNVMAGYYNNPKLTAGVIDREGYLHTGDIARMDKDGYITIRGRMKNIIVTKGGKNIYPEEIENFLLESEYISEVVVVPRSEGNSGEFPYAFIYPNFEAIEALEKETQAGLDSAGIRELIAGEIKEKTSEIADYKKVRGFEILEKELPKTSSNKVKRYMFKGK
ncbi:MAG: AMP-binding protein [Brevinematales bacterium]